ncbi:MAG: MFS transporter [Lachnospiraceae bacterium]|nr:MFS transporter [Lachnospiraceae bacterium]
MYLLLLSLIYLAFISLGLPDSLLGAAWPTMQESYQVPISYMGIISMIISGGTICSSLLSERLTHRFGTKYVTVFSVFLTAVALFGFSLSNSFWFLCIWAVPYGLGAGAIDAALNNYVAIHYTSRHISWLHCFWGVGTIISPYIMSAALLHSSWENGYRMVSLIQIAIAIILLSTLSIWKVNQKNDDEKDEHSLLGLKGALKIRGVPFILIGFLCYCAGESTSMLWASSYLTQARDISKEAAAAFAALFFIGITAGRFAAGFISEKIGDRKMIRLGTTIIILGIICMSLPIKTDVAALAGLVVIGLGCAPVYPCIIHSTPSHFGSNNSQAIIGIQMASAYMGSTFIPPLFGLIANHISIKLFPVFLLLFFIMMILMIETTYKKVN